jgi:5-methylcytosine-specific restriction endonuclease McrA
MSERLTYRDKLRDPRWQKKRFEILTRDNWTCCSCGAKDRNLQVHHLVYARHDPWEYDNECLQTLCEDCHLERQEITDKLANAMRIALKNIPTRRLEVVANRMIEEAFGQMGEKP